MTILQTANQIVQEIFLLVEFSKVSNYMQLQKWKDFMIINLKM